MYEDIDKIDKFLFLYPEQLTKKSVYGVSRVFEIINDDKIDPINQDDQTVDDLNKIQSLETVEQSDCIYKVPQSKLNEFWLQQLWLSKDSMLNSFYQDKDNFLNKFKPHCYDRINLFFLTDFILANIIYIPVGSTFIYLIYLSISKIFKILT